VNQYSKIWTIEIYSYGFAYLKIKIQFQIVISNSKISEVQQFGILAEATSFLTFLRICCAIEVRVYFFSIYHSVHNAVFPDIFTVWILRDYNVLAAFTASLLHISAPVLLNNYRAGRLNSRIHTRRSKFHVSIGYNKGQEGNQIQAIHFTVFVNRVEISEFDTA
jgi:hypothetical protein